ncbi:MAG: hypothetical protein JOZ54_15755 [Acidobacteria bacterium]|nr:hypothetical protein [Acidobacteriota bacterium]
MLRIAAVVLTLFVCASAFAALEVGEATNNVVTYNIASARPTIRLTILNPSKDDVTAAIVVIPFVDAGAETYDATPSATSLAIPKFGSAPLTITPAQDLAKAGDYTAILRLQAGDAVTTVKLKLTRSAAAAAGITVDDLPGVLVEMPVGLGDGTSAPFPAQIRETGGAPTTVAKPIVTSFLYKPNEKVSLNAPFPSVVAKTLAVPAKGTQPMPLIVSGIKSPGRYEGTLDFAGVSKKVTIYARQPWPVAALFIAAGVLVSFLLRWYAKVGRPRLAIMNRVGNIAAEARQAAATAGNDAEAVELAENFRAALLQRYDVLAASARLGTGADFDLFESKLPLLTTWIELHRDLLPLPCPPAARKTLEEALRKAATTIRNSAAAATEIAQQAGALGALRSDTEAAAATEIGKMLTDADAELAASADRGAAALRNRINAIRSQLLQRDFAGALEDLRQLRFDYLALLAKALERDLAHPPLGFTATWKPIADDARTYLDAARNATDPDVAFADLKKATEIWLRPAIASLRTVADAPAQAELDTIPAEIAAGKVLEAADHFRKLRSRFPDRKSKGIFPAMVEEDEIEADVEIASVPRAPSSANATLGIDTTFARTTVHVAMLLGNILSTLLIAALAILLGLKVLWVDDWTWGGATSALIAFAWGAGLHAVTYDGISGFFAKLIPSAS